MPQGSKIIAGHIFYRNGKFAAVQDMYVVEDEVVNSLISDPNMFPSSQLGNSEMAILKQVIRICIYTVYYSRTFFERHCASCNVILTVSRKQACFENVRVLLKTGSNVSFSLWVS